MPEHPRPAPTADRSASATDTTGTVRILHLIRRHPAWTALGAVVVLLAVLVALWDWNWFRGPVERMVSARTGRSFDIAGDLDVDLGWTPVLSANSLRFGNAAWGSEKTMAAADRIEFSIDPRALLEGRIAIPDLRLHRPVLLLEVDPGSGVGNWVFGEPGDTRMQLRRIRIDDGRLRFVDRRDRTDIRIGLASEQARQPHAAAPVRIAGGGHWRGNAFTLRGLAESPLALREAEASYRIDLHARASRTRAHARGTLFDPLRLRDFDLRLALSGQDLADLYPLIGLAIPPTPPYSLDGRLSRDDRVWRYADFEGRVGDSDLTGDASVETGRERPYFRADLRSRRLDFDDLAGFVGAAPRTGNGTPGSRPTAGTARAATRTRVLPETPYRLDKLRAMDADVHLRAARIEAPGLLPLDSMQAHLLLENGLLRLAPLNFGVAGGTLRATVRMDARGSAIRTRADARARGLDLARLLPKVPVAQSAVGRMSGHFSLEGTGNSIAAMLGSSDGEIAFGMGRGRISNLLMEMAGIDLAEIIKFKLAGDRQIPVRCAFGDFAVEDGLMSARALAFDTTDTILVGSGTINLRDERFDLTLRPRPKDRSLIALRTPLRVDGTFKQPRIRPELGPIGLRGAIALGLASIAPPAALLATLELGPGEDAGCGGRYAR